MALGESVSNLQLRRRITRSTDFSDDVLAPFDRRMVTALISEIQHYYGDYNQSTKG